MYSNNPHFNWMKCNFQALEDLPSQKKKTARDNVGKEVMLNVGGRRNHLLKLKLSVQQKELIVI